ncbi:MAG: hypothetical protein ABSH00_03315 [Bryobacteraceae bacterium]|jgi:hypothetical protein
MYAFRLPASIPAPGSPGGPPPPANCRYIVLVPFDWRGIFYRVIRDPQQMQSIIDNMKKMFTEAQKKQGEK